MKHFTILLSVILIFCGCGRRGDHEADISKISIRPVKVMRYDLDLFNANTADFARDIKKLQPVYRIFLGDSLDEPSKLSTLKDYMDNPRNQDFIKAVRMKYPEVSNIEKDLDAAFKHFKYYFPSFSVPKVYAYISGGDYEYPVQYSDSVLLIGLDNYLGKDYAPYKADGVPNYSVERMNEQNVVPDCVRLLANSNFPVETGGTSLLD